jgi:hypothetical protein
VKIRFNCTIPTQYGAFRMGQVIDVEKPTLEMQAWLQPLPDGTRRAEVVRDDDSEAAVAPVSSDRAVVRHRRTARGA